MLMQIFPGTLELLLLIMPTLKSTYEHMIRERKIKKERNEENGEN